MAGGSPGMDQLAALQVMAPANWPQILVAMGRMVQVAGEASNKI